MKSQPPVVNQTSAGGLAYRGASSAFEVAIVSVGKSPRWQLPKGLVERGETPEAAAVRETKEEAGIAAEIESALDTIEYWYVGDHEGGRARFHKRVHFFLMRYLSGDVADHDYEVNEARWVPLDSAPVMLAFASEKKIAERAMELLRAR